MNEKKSKETEDAATPAPRGRRRLWLRALVALVIFVSGFVAGSGAAVVVIARRVMFAIQHPERAPQRITDRLRRKLSLADGQAERVLAILTERQQELMAIRRDVRPRVRALLDGTYNDVAEVLDGEQREFAETICTCGDGRK